MWQRAKVTYETGSFELGQLLWVRPERTREGREIERQGGCRYVIEGQPITWAFGFEGHLGSAYLELLPEFKEE